MSSTTGVIFSYALGAIFLVGGLLFLILLDDNRFLFGVPYVIMGLVIVMGLRASQRRGRRRREVEGDGPEEPGRPVS